MGENASVRVVEVIASPDIDVLVVPVTELSLSVEGQKPRVSGRFRCWAAGPGSLATR